MTLPTLQDLLEAGVHFGHDPSRWNPQMAPYIFGTRNGVHILDLQQTLAALERATAFARDLAALGKIILFVGTKRQARPIVKQEAERCGMPYVTARWLGGTFTNFPMILRSIEKRALLAAKLASPEAALLTKKDRQKMMKDIERIDAVFEGLRNLRAIPDAAFLVGAHGEKLAVKEAQRIGLPLVALADTNADPTGIAYPIPANDDAVRSIALLVRVIADAVVEGRAAFAVKEKEKEPLTRPAPSPSGFPTPATPVPAGDASPPVP
ncbi:MAG: small subunit ribosomal protein S2 [Parcubacteria group bacterium Gr01-1014_38]|nr:MAG: small subunit ribosomal protein S2 [Parcubacteria group bacterium Gr01-1014_38]